MKKIKYPVQNEEYYFLKKSKTHENIENPYGKTKYPAENEEYPFENLIHS